MEIVTIFLNNFFLFYYVKKTIYMIEIYFNDMKNLYKLINEEINGFDFLGIEKINKEANNKHVLDSREFQTQFINDVITSQSDKSKFPKISASISVVDNDTTFNDVSKSVDIEVYLTYNYNGRDFGLTIFLSGGVLDNEEPDYENFDIKIYTKSGDKLDISWVFSNGDLIKKFIDSLFTRVK
jgi:hypothetical protein